MRELSEALLVIVRYVQQSEYSDEIRQLRNGSISKQSSLSDFNLFCDNGGILRVWWSTTIIVVGI